MNQNQNARWLQKQPYTLMLLEYRAAADRLLDRITLLRHELRCIQLCKKHTRESADAQRNLERRIDLLRSEYYEITDSMREIRIYADKERA